MVQLDGCDVDRGLGSSLKPTVGSLLLDASGSAATLVYSTAEGAIPRLTLVSMSGATVMTHDLPPGDGGERSITIALRDVPPGLYLLELRVESDRVVTPIMITR